MNAVNGSSTPTGRQPASMERVRGRVIRGVALDGASFSITGFAP